MDKTWVDNILALFGIFPGFTQIVKGSKFSKLINKFDKADLTKAINDIKNIKIFGESKNLSKIRDDTLKKIENIPGRIPRPEIDKITGLDLKGKTHTIKGKELIGWIGGGEAIEMNII